MKSSPLGSPCALAYALLLPTPSEGVTPCAVEVSRGAGDLSELAASMPQGTPDRSELLMLAAAAGREDWARAALAATDSGLPRIVALAVAACARGGPPSIEVVKAVAERVFRPGTEVRETETAQPHEREALRAAPAEAVEALVPFCVHSPRDADLVLEECISRPGLEMALRKLVSLLPAGQLDLEKCLRTSLDKAAAPDAVDVLLEAGADPYEAGGFTRAAAWSSRDKDARVLRAVVSAAGAFPLHGAMNPRERGALSPLAVAASLGDVDLLRSLLALDTGRPGRLPPRVLFNRRAKDRHQLKRQAQERDTASIAHAFEVGGPEEDLVSLPRGYQLCAALRARQKAAAEFILKYTESFAEDRPAATCVWQAVIQSGDLALLPRLCADFALPKLDNLIPERIPRRQALQALALVGGANADSWLHKSHAHGFFEPERAIAALEELFETRGEFFLAGTRDGTKLLMDALQRADVDPLFLRAACLLARAGGVPLPGTSVHPHVRPFLAAAYAKSTLCVALLSGNASKAKELIKGGSSAAVCIDFEGTTYSALQLAITGGSAEAVCAVLASAASGLAQFSAEHLGPALLTAVESSDSEAVRAVAANCVGMIRPEEVPALATKARTSDTAQALIPLLQGRQGPATECLAGFISHGFYNAAEVLLSSLPPATLAVAPVLVAAVSSTTADYVRMLRNRGVRVEEHAQQMQLFYLAGSPDAALLMAGAVPACELNSAVEHALHRGYPDAALELAKRFVETSEKPSGSALCTAVQYGCQGVVAELIGAGVSASAKRGADSPLVLAAQGLWNCSAAIVEALVKAGAQVDAASVAAAASCGCDAILASLLKAGHKGAAIPAQVLKRNMSSTLRLLVNAGAAVSREDLRQAGAAMSADCLGVLVEKAGEAAPLSVLLEVLRDEVAQSHVMRCPAALKVIERDSKSPKSVLSALLHYAASGNLSRGAASAAVVKALLDKGADPNDANGFEAEYPLQSAVQRYWSPSTVRALLDGGARVVNLSWYSIPQDPELWRILLTHRSATPSTPSTAIVGMWAPVRYRSPYLIGARDTGKKLLVKEILNSGKIETIAQQKAMGEACRGGYVEPMVAMAGKGFAMSLGGRPISEVLVEERWEAKGGPAGAAAAAPEWPVEDALRMCAALSDYSTFKGCKVHQTRLAEFGYYALHEYLSSAALPKALVVDESVPLSDPRISDVLFACCEKKKWDLLVRMLQLKATISLHQDGGTLLHHACRLRAPSAVVEELIRLPISILATDNQGMTALHFVPSARACELLLARGADPNALSATGRTPFECLSTVDSIIAFVCLVNKSLRIQPSFSSPDRLRVKPADGMPSPNGKHATLLRVKLLVLDCFQGRNESVVQSWHILKEVGIPALNLAASAGNTDLIEQLISKSKILGPDILGNTALHYACAVGCEQATRILLKHIPEAAKLSQTMKNKSGKTPLELAMDGESPQTLMLLLEAGVPLSSFISVGFPANSVDACDQFARAYLEKFRRETSGKFVDPDFGANEGSLWVNSVHPPKTATVPSGWKRVSEMSGDKAKLFAQGSPRPGQVINGHLGTDALLCAVAAVSAAERGAFLKSMFISSDDDLRSHGIVAIRMFSSIGRLVFVVVDDMLPVMQRKGEAKDLVQPVYCRCKSENEWYAPLLEKAVAKLQSCYEAIEGCTWQECLNILVGGCGHELDLESPEIMRHRLCGNVWPFLSGLHRDPAQVNFLMCRIGEDKPKESCLGLTPGHSYVITKMHTLQGRFHLLRLFNPYADDVWQGDWSLKSDRWTPALLAEALGEEIPKSADTKLNPLKESQFFIELEGKNGFLSLFSELEVSTIERKSHTSQMSSVFNAALDPIPTCPLAVILPGPATLVLEVTQDPRGGGLTADEVTLVAGVVPFDSLSVVLSEKQGRPKSVVVSEMSALDAMARQLDVISKVQPATTTRAILELCVAPETLKICHSVILLFILRRKPIGGSADEPLLNTTASVRVQGCDAGLVSVVPVSFASSLAAAHSVPVAPPREGSSMALDKEVKFLRSREAQLAEELKEAKQNATAFKKELERNGLALPLQTKKPTAPGPDSRGGLSRSLGPPRPPSRIGSASQEARHSDRSSERTAEKPAAPERAAPEKQAPASAPTAAPAAAAHEKGRKPALPTTGAHARQHKGGQAEPVAAVKKATIGKQVAQANNGNGNAVLPPIAEKTKPGVA
eukprot:m51a1_g5763 putative calpain-type cysteine protease family isoform 5 (2201) ;mRNA; r:1221157-1228041